MGGAPKRAPFNNPRFGSVRMGYRNGAVHRSLAVLGASFWVCLSALFLPLFRAVNKLFLRCEEVENNLDENQETMNLGGMGAPDQEKSTMGSAPVEAEEEEPDAVNCLGSDSTFHESDEGESPKLFLSFKFPTFKEFAANNRVIDNPDFVSREISAEEEEDLRCSDEERSEPDECFSDGNFAPQIEKIEILAQEASMEPRDYHESEKNEADPVIDENPSEGELLEGMKGHFFFDKTVPMQFRVLSEKDLLMSDSDTDSMSSSRDFSIMSRLLDSNSDGFLSDGDFEGDFGLNNTRESDEEDEDLREELRKLDESEEEIPREERNHKQEEEEEEGAEAQEPEGDNQSSGNTAEPKPENEDSKMEVEWEHQDLIEQLKMEIRKVRATGLPTIAEDDESPRITDDLKPWKIDEKHHRGDRMSELHKVYKSYQERMRKFDILNYQKMYALGFLRTKDPFKSISSQKSQTPSLISLLSQTLRLCREEKKSEDDPMVKFARELHGDLETVYVGQLCLSWEFLQWQYEKALELWEADPCNLRCYNEVANQFQQLQVLMQRFLENEQFEGPRVQYYVKSRCMQRNLLQIPVIREDNLKVKKKNRRVEGKSEFAVSSDVLVEILEESIRIFWRFVRADKDANGSTQKGQKTAHPELQDPADLELFSEVQTTLQKKEKKLKEVLKGGNCIHRKFQRHHHDQEDGSSSDQVAFFSQVDMKLVRRVLNMSRLSADQLGWCSGKLNRISFVHRKIHVEPSFLLFPC